jgi:hypothetical protein
LARPLQSRPIIKAYSPRTYDANPHAQRSVLNWEWWAKCLLVFDVEGNSSQDFTTPVIL